MNNSWKAVPALLCVLLLAGCAAETEQTASTAETVRETVSFAETPSIDETHLRDVDLLYDEDPYDVVTMYLTVREGNSTDGTDHTWEEVNTYSAYYYDELGIDRYKAAALLQVGDELGPTEGSLGFGESLPNATVQIRGQTSSRYEQKNYKIKLVDTSDGWRGQKTIALNKHMSEGMRFRNKLIYDLIADIPQIMGLRTQFVHLYVKDLTGDDPENFVDYGLYTQVEQLNKTALRAHGLDENGYLYKINFFEFEEYDAIVPVTDPDYDEAAFAYYLEPKTRQDHDRLIEMLAAVNDMTISSDELLDTWFDRENLSYWMAFMMLVGNSDVQSRNVYIYSPLNGTKWYFYPWDNDSALLDTELDITGFSDFDDWQDGVTNYWGNRLFRRALLSASFREELTAAVEDLYTNYLQPEMLSARIEKYAETVLPYVFRMPDAEHEDLTREQYDIVMAAMPGEVAENYARYYESLSSPMPFFVGDPAWTDGGLYFCWDRSLCLDGADVTYHVRLSRDAYGEETLAEESGLNFTEYTWLGDPEPGQYFLHVCAENGAGLATNCFDTYTGTEGSIYGVLSFFIEEDGSIHVYEAEE